VLSWRLSITMDVDFCLEAVEEALARYGRPQIFNISGCEFQAPQKCLRLIKVYAINFIP
jgi:putative transposase